MSYNNVDQAYILPDRGLTDAQKLSFTQNQRQLDEQGAERRYQIQQRQEGQNLNRIQGALDFDKYKTGEQAIDQYSQGELQKIYDDALANHVSDNPVALEGWLQGQIQPLAKWHTVTQNGYKAATEAADNFSKMYAGAADPALVRSKALKLLEDNVMNGKGERANTDYINLPDFNAELNKPDVVGSVAASTEPINQFYHGLDKTSIHDSDYNSNKGFSNRTKWSGYVTPLSTITPDANGDPVVDVKHEVVNGVKDEQGNPMKIIDKDVFAGIMSNPPLRMSYLKKWADLKPRIEQAYGRKLDPTLEDFAFKHMIYKDAYNNIPHDISKDEATVVPKPPHISINVNGGKGETAINDVYDEIASKTDAKPNKRQAVNELSPIAQQEVLKVARDVSGNKDLTQADILIAKDNKGSYNIYSYPDGAIIAPLDFKSTNLPANNSVKQKQVILHNSGNQPKQKTDNRTKVDY